MIKINLLPIKAQRKREFGQQQLLVFVLLIGLEIVGLIIYHGSLSAELTNLRKKNADVRTDIETHKKVVGDYDKVKKQLEELKTQKKILADLYRGRSGPVRMMDELTRIMSVEQGPSIAPEDYKKIIEKNPAAAIDPQWDPKKLFIRSFEEVDKLVVIKGEALANDVVAELLKRLELSPFFEAVQLKGTEKVDLKEMGLEAVQFEINFKVNYSMGRGQA